jgi:hypothetical protein
MGVQATGLSDWCRESSRLSAGFLAAFFRFGRGVDVLPKIVGALQIGQYQMGSIGPLVGT